MSQCRHKMFLSLFVWSNYRKHLSLNFQGRLISNGFILLSIQIVLLFTRKCGNHISYQDHYQSDYCSEWPQPKWTMRNITFPRYFWRHKYTGWGWVIKRSHQLSNNSNSNNSSNWKLDNPVILEFSDSKICWVVVHSHSFLFHLQQRSIGYSPAWGMLSPLDYTLSLYVPFVFKQLIEN